jgi:hypothetical protein
MFASERHGVAPAAGIRQAPRLCERSSPVPLAQRRFPARRSPALPVLPLSHRTLHGVSNFPPEMNRRANSLAIGTTGPKTPLHLSLDAIAISDIQI